MCLSKIFASSARRFWTGADYGEEAGWMRSGWKDRTFGKPAPPMPKGFDAIVRVGMMRAAAAAELSEIKPLQ